MPLCNQKCQRSLWQWVLSSLKPLLFIYYRSLPEFKEYILIDQTKYHVKQYTKTLEGRWLLTEYESEKTILELSSIEFQINLKDIYEKVNFADSQD
jgi:Uma2 family endonuclease